MAFLQDASCPEGRVEEAREFTCRPLTEQLEIESFFGGEWEIYRDVNRQSRHGWHCWHHERLRCYWCKGACGPLELFGHPSWVRLQLKSIANGWGSGRNGTGTGNWFWCNSNFFKRSGAARRRRVSGTNLF